MQLRGGRTGLKLNEGAIKAEQSHEVGTMAAPLTQTAQYAGSWKIVQVIDYEYFRLVPGGGVEPP